MLQRWLVDHVRTMVADTPYRPPTPGERTEAIAALRAVLAGESNDPRATSGVDDAGGPFTMLEATEHGWGTVILRPVSDVVIEVPHPGSDRFTARLGLELFHTIPSAALLVAGAHRRAGDSAADVAHRTDSLFHAYAQTLALPEIQLHGFAADTAPDTDAVVSPGAGEQGELHRRVEKALRQHGFRVGHHERLAGRTNVQGIAAAAERRPFLHLELAPLLRIHRDVVVDAVAKAVADTRDQQGD
ncbi:hypothetical protein [Actinophytocola algeriensis]|uniref:Uncharacterized protein n=1 Tax=Actinophytocola algeriensis TaxID=1768010 RepID=A0A7W7Q5P6_9PSEU|nr:hypothetical protein [Actinophytocola algeriensis]MBB4907551.1 hypothetical protein [Actinophytocola algeriensis]MBE1479581.1 hypothetical protein [Actinophytocola algeriensis]